MPNVFVSHAAEDEELALQIAHGLEQAGYSTWYYERDCLPGASYLLQEERAIDRCQAVVLLISPDSLVSHQVTKEVESAHQKNKRIVPLLCGINHLELQTRQPLWQIALGTTTCISVPQQGVARILGRILEGLSICGVTRAAAESHESVPGFAKPPARKKVCVPIPVPERLTRHFKDREADLCTLRQFLANRKLRMVSICGQGGVGKTTLAEKVIRELSEPLTEGGSSDPEALDSILYISLREPGYRTPERIVDLLGRALEPATASRLKDVWGQSSISLRERLSELFHGPLSQHRCLIVLDNLESVLDADNHIRDEFAALREFIDAFLEHDHAALLLVTSRRALALSPDVEVAGIGRRVQISLDDGLPEPFGIALLREMDCNDQHPLGIREAPIPVLADIVRRCQGIPHTLETLVGTLLQHRVWTLDTLMANEALLTRLIEDPAKERYESLTPDQERLVMHVLAVYDKPVPEAAVRLILPQLPLDEILDRLVRNMVASYDRGRFWLHPLDRQYAYSLIPESGSDYSRTALHRLAARYYLGQPCPPRGTRAALDDVAPMLDAFEHLLAADLAEEAGELLIDTGLHEDLYWLGHYILLADLCDKLLGRQISTRKRVALHIELGKIAKNLGKFSEAKQAYENALPLVGPGADIEQQTELWVALGDISLYLGELEHALTCHQKAEKLLREHPNPLLQSENEGDRGNVLTCMADYHEAQRAFERAIALSQECGDKMGKRYEGIWNGDLGNVVVKLFEESHDPTHRRHAIDYLLKAIAIAKETNDRRHESHWNGVLGSFLDQLGESDGAESRLWEALAISQHIHYERGGSMQIEWLTRLYSKRMEQCVEAKDCEAACQIARQFVELSEERLERQEWAANAEQRIGVTCVQWGRRTGLPEFCHVGVEAFTRAMRMCPDEAQHLFFGSRAEAHALLGNIDEAIADYGEVIQRNPDDNGAALSRIEVMFWGGRYEEAQDLLERLQPRLKAAPEQVLGAWLMCHILNVVDRDYSGYQLQLETAAREQVVLPYVVKDIEPYLKRLEQTNIRATQIENAWAIQKLIARITDYPAAD